MDIYVACLVRGCSLNLLLSVSFPGCVPMADYWDDEGATNLCIKRVRPWDTCDDVQELKRMLIDKEEELKRVVTDKEKQLIELQRKLKSAKKQPAKKQPAAGPAGHASLAPSSSPKAFKEQVSRLRKSIQSQVLNQMAYKPSARHGSARLVPVEIFDVTEPVIESLVGEELFGKASSGPKQLKLALSNDEVEGVFGRLSKTLRYGATLELTQGLKLVFTKSDGQLKVSGSYTMIK